MKRYQVDTAASALVKSVKVGLIQGHSYPLNQCSGLLCELLELNTVDQQAKLFECFNKQTLSAKFNKLWVESGGFSHKKKHIRYGMEGQTEACHEERR